MLIVQIPHGHRRWTYGLTNYSGTANPASNTGNTGNRASNLSQGQRDRQYEQAKDDVIPKMENQPEQVTQAESVHSHPYSLSSRLI